MTRQTLRDGRYVSLRELGHGGQAATFEAVDKREGRLVAIKRFDVRGAKAWKDVELAEREARVLRTIDHPLFPKYIEHFEESSVLYLVMEKIEGESVAALKRRGAFNAEDVVRFLRDAATALGYLHARKPPVIHRDIKPSNVIRRPDGSFAIVDFGAVRDRLRSEGASTVVGTFGYMAPEQMQARAMPASDVYAVGATAIAMLTGDEPENLPHRGLGIDVRSALRGRADERLIEALSAMLVPDPDARAQSVEAVIARIDAKSTGRGARKKAPEAPKARETKRERRAREHTAREERRARKRELRRKRGSRAWPFVPRLLVGLVLFAVQVVLMVVLGIAVPAVLMVLSLVLGRLGRDGAEGVARGGRAAAAAVGRARRYIGGVRAEDQDDDLDPRVRVEGSSETERVRVEDAEDHAHEEDTGEDLAPSKKRRAAR